MWCNKESQFEKWYLFSRTYVAMKGDLGKKKKIKKLVRSSSCDAALGGTNRRPFHASLILLKRKFNVVVVCYLRLEIFLVFFFHLLHSWLFLQSHQIVCSQTRPHHIERRRQALWDIPKHTSKISNNITWYQSLADHCRLFPCFRFKRRRKKSYSLKLLLSWNDCVCRNSTLHFSSIDPLS